MIGRVQPRTLTTLDAMLDGALDAKLDASRQLLLLESALHREKAPGVITHDVELPRTGCSILRQRGRERRILREQPLRMHAQCTQLLHR